MGEEVAVAPDGRRELDVRRQAQRRVRLRVGDADDAARHAAAQRDGAAQAGGQRRHALRRRQHRRRLAPVRQRQPGVRPCQSLHTLHVGHFMSAINADTASRLAAKASLR